MVNIIHKNIFLLSKLFESISRWVSKPSLGVSHILLAVAIAAGCYVRWSEVRQKRSQIPARGADKSINMHEHPVIVWWHPVYRAKPGKIHCGHDTCNVYTAGKRNQPKVDAYLLNSEHVKLDDLPLPRLANETIWGLYNYESPKKNPYYRSEKFYNLFNYSATFSVTSDVPIPLQLLRTLKSITSKKFYMKTSLKNSNGDIVSPILFMHSDCSDTTQRDEYVAALMKHVPIDCYGACVKNKPLPKEFVLTSYYTDETLKFVSKYKFAIAIENSLCENYVTEKLWRSLEIGVVPVYFGPSSVRDWLPNEKSAVLIEDYPTPKLLSDHIYRLLANDSLYEEYLEHKIKGIVRNPRLRFEYKVRPYQSNWTHITHVFECFVCRQVYRRLLDASVRDNVVTKRQCDCPAPTSALRLRVLPGDANVKLFEKYASIANGRYQQIQN